MSMNFLSIAWNFFLSIEVLENFQVVYWTFWIELFLAYNRTFGIFLIGAGIWEQVLVGSISSNVQNDLMVYNMIAKITKFSHDAKI